METTNRINQALTRSFPGENLPSSITQIAGDLSPRRYFRLFFEAENSIRSKTLLAMVFDSTTPPEAESKILRTSDQAYIELTEFFFKNSIPVPKLVSNCHDIGVLLIEDLGDNLLIETFNSKEEYKIKKQLFEAVNIVQRIQNIKPDQSFFAFQRTLDISTYVREANQFVDFVLKESCSESTKNEVKNIIIKLSNEIDSFQKVLVHRDFHAWNLIVDLNDKLRVIDFQDALLGPRSYDLVALIHERDVDKIITNEIIEEVENYYFSNYEEAVRIFEYPRVQLQRDLKVSGLFKRIVKQRGLLRYGEWVPGTVSRIKKTLNYLKIQDPSYGTLLEIIEKEV